MNVTREYWVELSDGRHVRAMLSDSLAESARDGVGFMEVELCDGSTAYINLSHVVDLGLIQHV